MGLNDEARVNNLRLWVKKLSQVGVDAGALVERYGDKIRDASYSSTSEHGNAYYGSMIETVLKVLTPYAVRINEILPQEIRCDKSELVKVCLLHQISKGVRMIPNDNQWEIEKRGFLFKYDDEQPSIRFGLHSIIMCTECGIQITPFEAEAMTIIDRRQDDKQSEYFSSTMATVLKQANELTYIEITNRNRNGQQHKQ